MALPSSQGARTSRSPRSGRRALGALLGGALLLALTPRATAAAQGSTASPPSLHGEAAPRDAGTKVAFAPAPAWVPALDLAALRKPPAPGGFGLVHLEQRVRYVGGEVTRFHRGVLDIESAAGVATAGRHSFSFCPPHEHLAIHRLEVRRDGQVTSHARPSVVEVLRREDGLEGNVVTGCRTAVALLPDIRVGDRIVYEYSVTGANPVLAGHVAVDWTPRLPLAVGSHQLEVTSDRPMHVRALRVAALPVETRRGDLYVYTAAETDAPAAVLEPGIPAEDDPLPLLQLGDVDAWSAVAAWGASLFAPPARVHPTVHALAEDLRARAGRPADAVLLALRWVQDNVRYVSFAVAESSHRPAPPEVVLTRRFGDCKDKSLLLASLLREAAIPADIALVSSTRGGALPAALPAIARFDHAVVSLELDGERYWLDATRAYQRGELRDVSAAHLGFGLLLRPDTTALTPAVSFEDSAPRRDVRMTYRAPRFGAPVTLEASVVFGGVAAEFVRGLRAHVTAKELTDYLSAPLRKVHPDLVFAGDAQVSDDEGQNQVTVGFEASLPDPWTTADPRYTKAMTVTPPWLLGVLPMPDPSRKYPLALEAPYRVRHTITFHLGAPLATGTAPLRVETAVATLVGESRSERQGDDAILTWTSDYQARSSRVLPPQLGELRETIRKMSEAMSQQVFEAKPLPASVPYALYGVLIVWLGAVAYGVLWILRKRPYWKRPEVPWHATAQGRRGWLALLGIQVSVYPIMAVSTARDAMRVLEPAMWSALASPASATFLPYWGPFATFEILGHALLVAGAFLAAGLYWTKHRSFPLVYVGVATVTIAFATTDAALVSTINAYVPSSRLRDDWTPVLRGCLGGLPWIAYALLSSRVKSTFLTEEDAGVADRSHRSRLSLAKD